MKEEVFVLIKPDGMKRALAGYILMRLAEAKLEIVASRMVKVSRELAKEHYKHLKGRPFFNELIQSLTGGVSQAKISPGLALPWRECD